MQEHEPGAGHCQGDAEKSGHQEQRRKNHEIQRLVAVDGRKKDNQPHRDIYYQKHVKKAARQRQKHDGQDGHHADAHQGVAV